MSIKPGEAAHKGHEIERRWIIDPQAAGALAMEHTGVRWIDQGYFWAVRREGGKSKRHRLRSEIDVLGSLPTLYTLTYKKRLNKLDHIEKEQLLGEEAFDELWPLTDGLRIQKSRLAVPLGSLTAEIDCFASGLVVGEVEFKSKQEARDFVVPEWCGAEITGLRGWSSYGLAKLPMGPQELRDTYQRSAAGLYLLPRTELTVAAFTQGGPTAPQVIPA